MSNEIDKTPVERVVLRFYGEITNFRCTCTPRPVKCGDMRIIVLRDSPIESSGSKWYRAQIVCPHCEMIFHSGLIPEYDAAELEGNEN